MAKEAKTRHSKSEGQNREEEMLNIRKGNGEIGSEERLSEGPGKAQTAFLNQRNQTPVKKEELVSRYDTQSAALDKSHSRERGAARESGRETKSQENWPQEPNTVRRARKHPEKAKRMPALRWTNGAGGQDTTTGGAGPTDPLRRESSPRGGVTRGHGQLRGRESPPSSPL